MKKRKQLGRVTVIAVSTALMATSSGVAVMAEAESIPTEISNLRVGNYTEPLAVEDEKPVFSWQLEMLYGTVRSRKIVPQLISVTMVIL